ncbi:MAG: hypothetical protein RLZZ196_1368 [Bacteroidota bacterium]|jgi:hypothetical protein
MKKEEKSWIKLQEQRFTTICILTNILEQDRGVSVHVKSAIASSLINMMETSMTEEDEPLKNLINNSIDEFCAKVEEEKGVENYREVLEDQVRKAKRILKELKKEIKKRAEESIERERRINEGNDILKGICLN